MKYGVEAFEYQLLAVVHSAKEAKHFETLWIVSLRAYDPRVGYNMTYGGEGVVPTAETRKRMSIASSTEERKEAMRIVGKSNAGKQKPHSVETCKKIGDGNRGKKKSVPSYKKGKTNVEFFGEDRAEELRLQNSRSHEGKKDSEETKKNKSKAAKKANERQELIECKKCIMKELWADSEYRQTQLEARKRNEANKKAWETRRLRYGSNGFSIKCEVKAKEPIGSGNRMKEKWQDPKYRQMQIDAHTGYKPTEEHIKNSGEGVKKSWEARRLKYPPDGISPAQRASFARTAESVRKLWQDPAYRS